MKKKRRRKIKPSDPLNGVEICEQALQLLRHAPAQAWLWYFAGTLPFFISLTYFLTALSESTLADQMVVSGALPVAGTYLWMKICQSKFMIRLWNSFGEEVPDREAQKGLCWRQICYQPYGLLFVQLSHLFLVPYPLTSSFFQNLSVCEALKRNKDNSPVQSAWDFAHREQMRTLTFLSIGKPALFLLVGVNWLMLLVLIPFLAYSLSGVENAIVRSPGSIMTVVFWMCVWMCTYITVDPLLKVFYLLRCAHIDARKTGSDLLRDLRDLQPQAGKIISLLMLLVLFIPFQGNRAYATEPAELDQTIEHVSQREHFLWRMPRDVLTEEMQEASGLKLWVQHKLDSLSHWIEANADLIAEWFRKIFNRPDPKKSPDFDFQLFSGLGGIAKNLLLVLLAVLIVATLLLFIRAWKNRQPQAKIETAPEGAPAPDISDEDVLATEMPMDSWLDLTRDLQAKGEWRLAMRALFLAFLSRLAERRLVAIRRSKSNREYEKEISLRGQSDLSLLPFFKRFRIAFESVWYGDYPAIPENVKAFQAWLEAWGKQP